MINFLVLTSMPIAISQNFLFTSRSEDADMKLIDFGLSDFIRPGNYFKLNYYVLCPCLTRHSESQINLAINPIDLLPPHLLLL